MSIVGSLIGGLALLVVIVWVGVFGTAGAALSADRDASRMNGFVLGALTGPLGCAWLLLKAHRSRPLPTNSTVWLEMTSKESQPPRG